MAVALVTLVDDPTEPEAYGASRFDAEGLASRRNVLIEDGVLAGFLHNSYTGRRTGRASNAAAVRGGYMTGPGVGSRALTLTPGTGPRTSCWPRRARGCWCSRSAACTRASTR